MLRGGRRKLSSISWGLKDEKEWGGTVGGGAGKLDIFSFLLGGSIGEA